MTLQDSIREIDTPARWGGEEFVVLLPETDERNALLTAERFRATIENMPPLEPDFMNVTVSVGVVTYRQAEVSSDELIDRADAAMYFAKETSRNKVIAWDESIEMRSK